MKNLIVILMLLAATMTCRSATALIETQFTITENGTTFSAPRATSAPGSPFQIAIGAPIDEASSAMPVGATLKGVVSLDDKIIAYELIFTARELDAKSDSRKAKVYAFTTKEYLLVGRAVLNEEISVKLKEGKSIIIKFSEPVPNKK